MPKMILCHLWWAAFSLFVGVAVRGHTSSLYWRVDRIFRPLFFFVFPVLHFQSADREKVPVTAVHFKHGISISERYNQRIQQCYQNTFLLLLFLLFSVLLFLWAHAWNKDGLIDWLINGGAIRDNERRVWWWLLPGSRTDWWLLYECCTSLCLRGPFRPIPTQTTAGCNNQPVSRRRQPLKRSLQSQFKYYTNAVTGVPLRFLW